MPTSSGAKGENSQADKCYGDRFVLFCFVQGFREKNPTQERHALGLPIVSFLEPLGVLGVPCG